MLLLFSVVCALAYLVLWYVGWFAGAICTSKRRLHGKVVVITGGNTGIGFETALDLAKRGACIIMGCLDAQSAAE